MLWIVQDNIFQEKAVETLIDTLDRYELNHTFVKVIPFTNGEILSNFEIQEGTNAIVIGSATLNKFAKNKRLYPGTFDNENFNYLTYCDKYGERMLNYDMEVYRLDEVHNHVEDNQTYFIRPNDDGKAFAGEVIEGSLIKEWFERIMRYNPVNLNESTLIMVCPIKILYNETRFIVIDGKVITGSVYKVGDRVSYSDVVEQEIWDYAQECVDIWTPDDIFVIDIARTPEGLKVIEINNFNSAGWYECDVPKVVQAIENKYERI